MVYFEEKVYFLKFEFFKTLFLKIACWEEFVILQ